jgi:hypothetical protein
MEILLEKDKMDQIKFDSFFNKKVINIELVDENACIIVFFEDGSQLQAFNPKHNELAVIKITQEN